MCRHTGSTGTVSLIALPVVQSSCHPVWTIILMETQLIVEEREVMLNIIIRMSNNYSQVKCPKAAMRVNTILCPSLIYPASEWDLQCGFFPSQRNIFFFCHQSFDASLFKFTMERVNCVTVAGKICIKSLKCVELT